MRSVDDIDLTDLRVFAGGPPHEAYQMLRDEAPVHWNSPRTHTPGGEGFWSLTRHADVSWAAKHAELFSSVSGGARDGGGTLIEDLPLGFGAGVLFNMQDDPRHNCVRRLVTPSVSPKRLREIEAALAERCQTIVDSAIARGSCDFLVDVAAELPLQAVASLLGVPQEDRHFFLAWADTTLDFDDRDPGQGSQRSQDASAKMFEYSSRLLQEKRGCPADDLTSIIAAADLPPEANPGGPLSELEQQMFFSLLVAAGSETTRNSIAAGVLALMERPDQWQALRDDRELVPTAIEEILRWASSTIYNRRTATEDIERHGEVIRAGDKVVLWWEAANFDDRIFDEPRAFNIRRTPNPHVSFGLGTHFCLGANLARMEIRLMFEQLLDKVGSIELTGPVERTRSNKHAGYRHMPVAIRGRS
jgi:cytochrome P450